MLVSLQLVVRLRQILFAFVLILAESIINHSEFVPKHTLRNSVLLGTASQDRHVATKGNRIATGWANIISDILLLPIITISIQSDEVP